MDTVQVKLFEEANAEDLGAAEHQLAQLGIIDQAEIILKYVNASSY
jgi:hypothetical protein